MKDTLLQNKIIYNTAVQIGGKVASVGLGFITVSILTRYLGVVGYGDFTLIFTYLSLFGVLADFGLHLTMVRTFSQGKSAVLYGPYIIVKLFLIGIAMGSAILALPFFPYLQTVKESIILGSLAFSIGTLISYNAAIFQSQVRLDMVTLIDVVTKFFTVGFMLFGVVQHLGIFFIVGSVIAGNIVGLVLSIWYLRGTISMKLPLDTSLIRRIVIQSIPVGISSFLALLYFKIDVVLLSVMRSSQDVGIYSLATRILEHALVLWGLYMASVYPLIAKFFGREQKEKLNQLFLSTIRTLLVSSSLTVVMGFILAPAIISVLGGKEFSLGVVPLRILLLSLPFFFLNNTLYHTILAIGKAYYTIVPMIFSLCVNIGLNLIIIPRWGYVGTSSTTVATEMILSIGYLIVMVKLGLMKRYLPFLYDT